MRERSKEPGSFAGRRHGESRVKRMAAGASGLEGSSPAHPVLRDDEVDVWCAPLDISTGSRAALECLLAPDERRRAEQYHLARDRERFLVCRGRLRVLLGRYLGKDPSLLRFTYGVHGKPALAATCGDDHLEFNLSHSDGLALFALTRGRELGVDIERLRSDLSGLEIARHFFSPREVAALCALQPDLQEGAFFKCWTCKEAYIKGRGEGLACPLDQFDVALAPGERATLLRTLADPEEAARWSLWELAVPPGYAAALAVKGHGWRLRCWTWPEDEETDSTG